MRRRFPALAALVAVVGGACDGGSDRQPATTGTTATTAAVPDPTSTTAAPPPSDHAATVRAAAGRALAAVTATFEHRAGFTLAGRDRELLTTGTLDASIPVLALESDVGSLLAGRYRTGTKVGLVLEGPRDEQMLYVRFPQPIEGTKRWLSVDPSRTSPTDAREAGLDLSVLFAHLQSAHALASVALLGGVEAPVVDAGEEEVGGAPAQRFNASVNLKVALERLPAVVEGPHGDDIARAVERMAGVVGPRTLDVDVWIADGVPRRIVYELPLSQPGDAPGLPAGAAGPVRIQVDVVAYEQVVPAAVPDAGEAVPFEEFADR